MQPATRLIIQWVCRSATSTTALELAPAAGSVRVAHTRESFTTCGRDSRPVVDSPTPSCEKPRPEPAIGVATRRCAPFRRTISLSEETAHEGSDQLTREHGHGTVPGARDDHRYPRALYLSVQG